MAGGNFGGGTGTVLSPFLIEDAADLNAIRNQPTGKYFKLVNDIDLSLEALNAVGLGASGAGWAPLVSQGQNYFMGSLNFNFHKITNLYINRPTEDCIGLFKRFAGFDFSNMIVRPRIEGVNIIGRQYVGGLVGEFGWWGNSSNCVGVIESISVSGIKIQGTDYVGGVVGSFYANLDNVKPLLRNVKVEISEISGVNYVGGVAGVFYRNNSPTVNTYPKFYNVLVILDRIYGTSVVGGILGGTNQSSGQASDFVDCYAHIKKYERVFGTAESFGEICGNISTTFTRCFVLDSREFISV